MEQKNQWEESTLVAASLIKFFENHHPNVDYGIVLKALLISFTSLAKGMRVSMHDTIEMVITVYKNTEIRDE